MKFLSVLGRISLPGFCCCVNLSAILLVYTTMCHSEILLVYTTMHHFSSKTLRGPVGLHHHMPLQQQNTQRSCWFTPPCTTSAAKHSEILLVYTTMCHFSSKTLRDPVGLHHHAPLQQQNTQRSCWFTPPCATSAAKHSRDPVGLHHHAPLQQQNTQEILLVYTTMHHFSSKTLRDPVGLHHHVKGCKGICEETRIHCKRTVIKLSLLS